MYNGLYSTVISAYHMYIVVIVIGSVYVQWVVVWPR